MAKFGVGLTELHMKWNSYGDVLGESVGSDAVL